MPLLSGRKRQFATTIVLLFAGITLLTASDTNRQQPVAEINEQYQQTLDNLLQVSWQIEQEALYATPERIQMLFVKARTFYKKAEWLIEYHYPASAQKLNGPALLEAEQSEPNEPQYPTGFQVLEEAVFENVYTGDIRQDIRFEASNIISRIKWLETLLPELELSASNLLDALRLNMYRLITKGITGFDAPVSLNGVKEAVPVLESAATALSSFPHTENMRNMLENAIVFVQQTGDDFDAFDRAFFITRHINLFCSTLHDYQIQHRIPFPAEKRAVSVNARHLFESGAFDPLFYAPAGVTPATETQILLGRKLFHEPLLSSNGKRSCATCHLPEKAFTDGKSLNETISGNKLLQRNTPTLWNAALQPVQFYDSRIAFLEDQVHDVISNKEEMGGILQKIATQLRQQKTYRQLSSAAYGTETITEYHIKAGLAAYVRSLTAMNSPFDHYMRGDTLAMNPREINGFNLFMGKAKCATCHFPPLFTGTVPPLFDKMESEVLGIPVNTDTIRAVMDTDSGKFHLYSIPHHLYSFKTTTVRNIALTAPYMHNGVFATLEEVLDFYNRGGGAGLSFDLPHQTLPPDRLHLSVPEQQDIIAFMRTLTDTTLHQ